VPFVLDFVNIKRSNDPMLLQLLSDMRVPGGRRISDDIWKAIAARQFTPNGDASQLAECFAGIASGFFKKARAKPSADLWPAIMSVNLPHPESLSICRIPVDLGVSEPEDGDDQPMVVSKEFAVTY
jgi:hypothetical protein